MDTWKWLPGLGSAMVYLTVLLCRVGQGVASITGLSRDILSTIRLSRGCSRCTWTVWGVFLHHLARQNAPSTIRLGRGSSLHSVEAFHSARLYSSGDFCPYRPRAPWSGDCALVSPPPRPDNTLVPCTGWGLMKCCLIERGTHGKHACFLRVSSEHSALGEAS